jgi:hypothetical protein
VIREGGGGTIAVAPDGVERISPPTYSTRLRSRCDAGHLTGSREKAIAAGCDEERQARASNVDFTRYDVRIGDESHSDQWKRNAIFLICHHLCQNGVQPDEIAALLDWRRRVWFAVDGVNNAAEFEKRAVEKTPNFDPGGGFVLMTN